MFNNMKNKIREKTGTEINKFLNTSLQGKMRSRQHSRQSSQTSISSFISDHSNREEEQLVITKQSTSEGSMTDESMPNNIESNLAKNNGEAIIGETFQIDWEKKYMELQKEWKEKETIYVSDLLKQTKELQETLISLEDSQKKYHCCFEEKQRLENYQKQEMSRIKQLLLSTEEENKIKEESLKETLSVVESLKSEVNRLRPFEEQINNCQSIPEDQRDEKENKEKELLITLDKEHKSLKDSYEKLQIKFNDTIEKERLKNDELSEELTKLKTTNDELKLHLLEEKDIKDKTLFRNAEISQQIQLSDQELKRQQIISEEFMKKIEELESSLKISQRNLMEEQRKFNEQSNSNNIDSNKKFQKLENEVMEKNKIIRILQQKLSDMKKTMQEGLIKETEVVTDNNNTTNGRDDVNFTYMKHVIMKFLTSSEYEAQHMIRAVATLLHLSKEEERLLQQAVSKKSTWFSFLSRTKSNNSISM